MTEAVDHDPVHFRWNRPALCPACKSRRIATIIWGMPSSEVIPDLESGKVVCGGCCVSTVDPSWECLDCGIRVYAARKRPEYLRVMDFAAGAPLP